SQQCGPRAGPGLRPQRAGARPGWASRLCQGAAPRDRHRGGDITAPARTPLHHLRNGIGVGFIREHPRPPPQLKDTLVPAEALADMNADVEVEADFDVLSPINLAHEPSFHSRTVAA